MRTIIEIKNLSKKYRLRNLPGGYISLREVLSDFRKQLFQKKTKLKDEFWALKDINININKGDTLGIIGPNGAGKSTLLKILSKVTPPTTGEIKLRGKVSSLLEVGTGFHPELTGRENIYLNGAILGMGRKEVSAKLDQIVAFSELERFLDMPVKHFSSGMYTRLAFSVVAYLDPDILVIDEILSVGDAAFQKRSLEKIREVSGSGVTVLMVSHNMANISFFCNKAILLSSGKVTAIGKPENVIKKYISSASKQNGLSLEKRRDRKGSGDLIVTEIAVKSRLSKTVNVVPSGEPISFVIDTKARQSVVGKNASITLLFVDSNDFRLFSLASELAGKTFPIKKGGLQFHCHVPAGLPLIAGTYKIHIFLLVHGMVTDKIMYSREIEVIESNFFKTGLTLPPFLGPFLISQDWSIK